MVIQVQKKWTKRRRLKSNAWGFLIPISKFSLTTTCEPTLNLFINENFTMYCNLNYFCIENLIRDKSKHGYIISFFDQIKTFDDMKFTSDAQRILNTPNAGGSSIESEILSFEVLKKIFNAKLLKTEMEVMYWPEGGSMNDYVTFLFGSIIGVSVTRAMNFKNEKFTFDEAIVLLNKKLKGICQSSKNSMIKWDKQILHVWLMNEQVCEQVLNAWEILDSNLKSNTVLLVTVAKNSKDIFINKKKKK